jgi:hypothetical protein
MFLTCLGIYQHVPWLFSILKFFSLNAPGQLSPSFHILSDTAFIAVFAALPQGFSWFQRSSAWNLGASSFSQFSLLLF